MVRLPLLRRDGCQVKNKSRTCGRRASGKRIAGCSVRPSVAGPLMRGSPVRVRPSIPRSATGALGDQTSGLTSACRSEARRKRTAGESLPSTIRASSPKCRSMRHLLALLAVLGLLLSPVTAAAALRDCAKASPEMAEMATDAASADRSGRADPCCDEGHETTQSSNKSCVQACAVMCGVVATLPTSQVFLARPDRVRLSAEAATPLASHLPPLAERPPKLIA